tara:strand:- start:387 stop:617 length:231 start_codon:yes stop_codon:yes gene_type:complete
MPCYLCREESRISSLGYYCHNCKKIQDLLSVYGKRVYEVLEQVLIRKECQQKFKIQQEIKKEVNKEINKNCGSISS